MAPIICFYMQFLLNVRISEIFCDHNKYFSCHCFYRDYLEASHKHAEVRIAQCHYSLTTHTLIALSMLHVSLGFYTIPKIASGADRPSPRHKKVIWRQRAHSIEENANY